MPFVSLLHAKGVLFGVYRIDGVAGEEAVQDAE
jgi:hypothetical protein